MALLNFQFFSHKTPKLTTSNPSMSGTPPKPTQMSSWKEKLANKTTNVTTPAAPPAGGWKQRINEKQLNPHQVTEQKPVIAKVSIDDLNDFPALGSKTPSQQPPKKQPTITGFASLAREWSEHDKEEKEREDKERMYREQQENAYNYNISKLSAINNRLMQFNYNQVRYNDEYNADYNNDMDNHYDE